MPHSALTSQPQMSSDGWSQYMAVEGILGSGSDNPFQNAHKVRLHSPPSLHSVVSGVFGWGAFVPTRAARRSRSARREGFTDAAADLGGGARATPRSR